MAFFRTINFADPLPTVAGEGVLLRIAQATDYADWTALREEVLTLRERETVSDVSA